ncbi:helicase-related protein [Pantoea piersonii]|jgi:superfamily II DNA or RNA helicase|uniref:helicase-related protein n=1 Tax=Pantoea piersonii TaxID=2364647 RepID=UPI000EA2E08D|nr:SNF2-related protein [Pantoea piersonii]MBZ6385950.1 DEAD/DEAH box helicase family protein [Pantoea piersonii]MBZ6399453.1 DEAD/DEAH box helicase family protein [Pantoea piersonii]MBZ6408024.1 DEAD/DEAH box helicase family protein [Pantoea piersonii]MBZ6427053.1 DEAD/DEAH box helicase family protein [Pantoea piersonii]NYB04459.1 DEAD/DEAH box helicase family protein [Pantoea piersonii]
MYKRFQGWSRVADLLRQQVSESPAQLNAGQKATLSAIAERIEQQGMILADEVGMGKTRIAATLARCVIQAGGRVAVLIPGGLAANWQEELKTVGVIPSAPLLSLKQYMRVWAPDAPSRPWFAEQCLIISHAMANWRLGAGSYPWRWGLLPELCQQWLHQRHERTLSEPWLKRAAQEIYAFTHNLPKAHPARKTLDALAAEVVMKRARRDEHYTVESNERRQLETSVGLGLGTFDLIIVDEAHKSRGASSSLNRVLENVIQPARHARRLAVSATPVELHRDQWKQMLQRINVHAPPAIEAIEHYQSAVDDLRQNYTDPRVQQRYRAASAAFQQALSPYLLRRDKREDESVQKYYQHTTRPYRREKAIVVDTFALSMAWKQAVCAAEALSFVSRMHEDSAAKRLRLTFGNGHGIATVMNNQHDETPDAQLSEIIAVADDTAPADKRQQRARWWQRKLNAVMKADDEFALFNHPAILATVNAVEAVCDSGEKVLVFGRFTQPMRALVKLINARALLKALDKKEPWPQEYIREDEWPAIQCASRQLYNRDADQAALTRQLKRQYRLLSRDREAFRHRLLPLLQQGLESCENDQVNALFTLFAQRSESGSPHRDLVSVAHALYLLTNTDAERHSPLHLAGVFTDLINAARDRDHADGQTEAIEEAQSTELRWQAVLERLDQEYGPRESHFARLMDGNTAPPTRQLLNFAFNRPHCHPSVLVAQSLVAREGLNLHLACRTVVMMHPEWNPGVAEQQIGRVDRLNSLWQKKLDEALAAGQRGDQLPTIDFCPVIFKGTYDEQNWQVLSQRWDDLRAQLHGNPFSASALQDHALHRELIQSVLDSAPNFSPLKRAQSKG